MAKVKYIDHDGGADEVEVFGVKFKDGKETTVSDDVAIRLMGNRYFQSVAPKAEHPAKAKAEHKSDESDDKADDKTA